MKRDNYYNKYHETFVGHINHTIWGISYDLKIQLSIVNDRRHIINPCQQKVHHRWLVLDFLLYEREIDFHAYSGHFKHNMINLELLHRLCTIKILLNLCSMLIDPSHRWNPILVWNHSRAIWYSLYQCWWRMLETIVSTTSLRNWWQFWLIRSSASTRQHYKVTDIRVAFKSYA